MKRISIEYIEHLQYEINRINAFELSDMEFYENEKRIEISKKVKEDFEFTGLSNVDFITSKAYKK